MSAAQDRSTDQHYREAVRDLAGVYEVEFTDEQIDQFWEREISVTKLEEYLEVWKNDQATLRFIQETLGQG